MDLIDGDVLLMGVPLNGPRRRWRVDGIPGFETKSLCFSSADICLAFLKRQDKRWSQSYLYEAASQRISHPLRVLLGEGGSIAARQKIEFT